SGSRGFFFGGMEPERTWSATLCQRSSTDWTERSDFRSSRRKSPLGFSPPWHSPQCLARIARSRSSVFPGSACGVNAGTRAAARRRTPLILPSEQAPLYSASGGKRPGKTDWRSRWSLRPEACRLVEGTEEGHQVAEFLPSEAFLQAVRHHRDAA